METKNIVKAFTTELNLTEKGFAELIEKKDGLLIDVTTDSGFKLARKERSEMNGIHKNIDRLAIDGKKSIDEIRANLKDRVTAIYAPIVDAFETEDLKRKEIAERKAKAEAERIAAIKSRIDGIRSMVNEAKGKNSADIADIIESVDLIDPADNFQDLTQEAAQAIKETLIELNGLLSNAILQEQMQKEREELRKEREELEALRAQNAAYQAERAQANPSSEKKETLVEVPSSPKPQSTPQSSAIKYERMMFWPTAEDIQENAWVSNLCDKLNEAEAYISYLHGKIGKAA